MLTPLRPPRHRGGLENYAANAFSMSEGSRPDLLLTKDDLGKPEELIGDLEREVGPRALGATFSHLSLIRSCAGTAGATLGEMGPRG